MGVIDCSEATLCDAAWCGPQGPDADVAEAAASVEEAPTQGGSAANAKRRWPSHSSRVDPSVAHKVRTPPRRS